MLTDLQLLHIFPSLINQSTDNVLFFKTSSSSGDAQKLLCELHARSFHDNFVKWFRASHNSGYRTYSQVVKCELGAWAGRLCQASVLLNNFGKGCEDILSFQFYAANRIRLNTEIILFNLLNGVVDR